MMNFVVSERGVEGTSFGEIGVFVTGCRDARRQRRGGAGRRATAWKTRRRERREMAESSSSAIAAAGAGSHSTLSLSLFFCFSLLKKKTASPAAPRSRRKCARFAPPPQQAREFGPCCTKGTRRDATGGARSGEKAGSMVEAPRPKSYLNAPPLSLLAGALFSFLCFVPSSKEKKEALSSSRPPQALEKAAARLLSRAGGWSAFARYRTYREKHEQRRTWLRSGARKKG